MADRTLLVPGTQATSLADQNGTVVYNAVRVSLGLPASSASSTSVAGPAGRLDILDVVVVQARWMFPAGPSVALEVTGALLCDLFC